MLASNVQSAVGEAESDFGAQSKYFFLTRKSTFISGRAALRKQDVLWISNSKASKIEPHI